MFRELDYVEKFYFWRTQLKYYSNCRVAAEYNVTLTPETVFNALSELLKSFLHLATTISRTNDSNLGYHINLIDSLKLGDVVEFIEDESLNDPEALLDRYHKESFIFGEDIVLWKLKVVNKKYVVFFYDHAIYDGSSGKNFHVMFGKAISSPNKTSHLPSYENMNSLVFNKSNLHYEKSSIMPDPCQVLDYSSPLPSLIYQIVKHLAPKFLSNLLKYWFDGNSYSKLLTYNQVSIKSLGLKFSLTGSNCRILNLAPKQLGKLLRICRDHDVKLTSLIVTISQMSLGMVLKSNEDTVTSVPVDLRPLLDVQKGEAAAPNFSELFGLYMSAVQIELPSIKKISLDTSVNWQLVSYIHNKIHQQFKYAPRLIGLLQYVNPKELILKKIQNQEKSTLEVSNLGAVSSKVNPEIENIWFDQPPELFIVNVISGASGANLVMRTLDPVLLEDFYTGILQIIDSLII